MSQSTGPLKEARQKLYSFFEDKGFVFPEGSKGYLSQFIKDYSKLHNDILLRELHASRESINRLKKGY